MKGLIYKDLAGSKREVLLAFLMCGAFSLFSVLSGGKSFSACVGAVVGISAIFPTFSLQKDETSGWNRFVCASPIPRNRVILSKYIIIPFCELVFLVMGLTADLACGMPVPFWTFLCFYAISLVFAAIMIPICIRLGQNIATIAFLLVVFVPVGIFFLLLKSGVLSEAMIDGVIHAMTAFPYAVSAAALAFSLVLLACSYFLTCRLYQRMEF